MKDQRHKRKESFSVLVISNTGKTNKQFQISLFFLRLIVVLFLVFCIAIGWFIYQFSTEHRKQEALRAQLIAQEEMTQQLKAENKTLRQNNKEKEIKDKTTEETAETEGVKSERPKATSEPVKDSTYPSLYPSKGSGVLKSKFSPEQPFISINAYTGGTIIAAGDGTVITVSSDEAYKHIIEIKHDSGYTTRYLCHKEAELKVAEGTQVKAGDILLNVTADDTQLDYQIVYENSPVDPLTVIDAKG